jgi:DNA-binding SARP family transcriptional activator
MRFIELDPTRVKAYLRLSSIYAKKKQFDHAREVLQRGLNYFGPNMSKYIPRPDDTVKDKYNDKARKIYDRHRTAVEILMQEIKLYQE